VRSDLSKVRTTTWRSTRQLWRFNCKTGTSATVSFIAYAPDGSVVRSHSDPYAAYEPVAPDTIGDTLLKDVCKGLQ
jgi:hypothetical protein